MTAPNGQRRAARDTAPIDEPVALRVEAVDLQKIVRDAVHQEMRHSVRVELEGRADMRDRILFVMALSLAAAVIALAVALSFSMWGTGR